MDRETAEPTVRAVPGEKAREWVRYHGERAAKSTYVYGFVWDVTADAEGPFCTDVDGNVLLDFTSHVASAPLGYNNPKILDRAREFDLVDPLNIAGQDFYVSGGGPPDDPAFPGPTQLMDRLVEVTPGGMDTVFLSNSGAEAVENAIKICYDHRDGQYAVTFEGGFHGRTLGALSLNRSKAVHRRKYPGIGGVHDVPFCDDRTCTRETCSCGFFPDGDGPSALARKLALEGGHVAPEEVSYVILEPIQGEGGFRFPSEEFMAELAALCETYEIPLVADEIQAGLGRTGEMWASEHYPIEPDVITAAKGLRVGATVAREELFPDEKGRLSSTWGAGAVLDSMYGVLTLDAIREHDLTTNAVRRGRHLTERLVDASLESVEDVRGRGLMVGVEFDSKARRDDVMAAALQGGLLTLGCGHKTLRLLPPLDVTEREVDIGVDLLTDAVRSVE